MSTKSTKSIAGMVAFKFWFHPIFGLILTLSEMWVMLSNIFWGWGDTHQAPLRRVKPSWTFPTEFRE
jgi:hypothetical protein